MQIKVFRATDAHKDLPSDLFWALDGDDDRFIAAFLNYPDSLKYVVAAWGTTGDPEVKGQPIAAIVATFGQIITGYVDLLLIDEAPIDPTDWPNDDLPQPIQHQEPNPSGRRRALLAALRRATKAEWFIVHDADEVESWMEQGFRVIAPPPNISHEDALTVLAWGTLPEDVYALLRARGLGWNRDMHRYGHRRAR